MHFIVWPAEKMDWVNYYDDSDETRDSDKDQAAKENRSPIRVQMKNVSDQDEIVAVLERAFE